MQAQELNQMLDRQEQEQMNNFGGGGNRGFQSGMGGGNRGYNQNNRGRFNDGDQAGNQSGGWGGGNQGGGFGGGNQGGGFGGGDPWLSEGGPGGKRRRF